MGFLISSPASILNYKKAARAASVANVALSGGATLTIDGVSLSNLDRVLLKNQTLPAENGIYEITGLGTAYALARSSDANSSSAFKINMAVAISEGAVNADKIFQITSDVPIDLGVTSITFTAIDSAALVAVAAEQARAIAAEALALQKSSNLSDLASVGTAKTNLSLQNVDNTSDANKPVSSAQQTALNLKADLISPVFTTPNIGSATGSISGNAATVTTNANLTGPVTSSGNATAIANAAISNAMLANAAVANLSGTNTGDNSAASLVPSQASQANKVLATDGTTSSWQYAGLGAGSLGTNNIILGAAMPVGFTSNACLLIGHTPPLLRYGGGYNQDMNVIIGNGATLTGIYTRATVAVGASAVVQAEGDVAVGASASANNGVAIGSNVSSGSGGVAIASSSGLRGVCIGKSANNGVDGVSIGNTSRHYGSESVGIGANVGGYNTGTRTTSVGFRAGGGGVGTTEYVPTNNSAFFGAYAGAYCKNVHNELFIDTLDRSTYANQQTKSLLYGTFNATASSQTLAINAAVSTPYTLAVTGVATFTAAPVVSSVTASQILASSATKEVVSLSTATYPSLTELAYVKDVTSAIQTQLNAKAPIASPTFTGTVLVPNGAVATPSYSFANSTNSGMFYNNGVNLCYNGSQGLQVAANDVYISKNLSLLASSFYASSQSCFLGPTTFYSSAIWDSDKTGYVTGVVGLLGRGWTGGLNRPHRLDVAQKITVGKRITGSQLYGATLSVCGTDALTSTSVTTNNPNNSTTIIANNGDPSGANIDVGDIISLSGESPSRQARITALTISYPNVTYTVDSALGDGTNRTVVYEEHIASFRKADGTEVLLMDKAGNVTVNSTLKIKEGSNARMGVATLVGGTVTVSNTSVTANTRIMLTSQDPNGGTVSYLSVSARTASTSFTILSGNILDTSIVAWMLVEPAP